MTKSWSSSLIWSSSHIINDVWTQPDRPRISCVRFVLFYFPTFRRQEQFGHWSPRWSQPPPTATWTSLWSEQSTGPARCLRASPTTSSVRPIRGYAAISISFFCQRILHASLHWTSILSFFLSFFLTYYQMQTKLIYKENLNLFGGLIILSKTLKGKNT